MGRSRLKWGQMVPNRFKCILVGQNEPKCAQVRQMVSIGFKWAQMNSYGLLNMTKQAQMRRKMGSIGLKWAQKGSNEFKWDQ